MVLLLHNSVIWTIHFSLLLLLTLEIPSWLEFCPSRSSEKIGGRHAHSIKFCCFAFLNTHTYASKKKYNNQKKVIVVTVCWLLSRSSVMV